MQERRNSSALAIELRLSCANPSNYFTVIHQCEKTATNIQWHLHGRAGLNKSCKWLLDLEIKIKIWNGIRHHGCYTEITILIFYLQWADWNDRVPVCSQKIATMVTRSFNSFFPDNAPQHHWYWSLEKLMVCHMIDAKPLSKKSCH